MSKIHANESNQWSEDDISLCGVMNQPQVVHFVSIGDPLLRKVTCQRCQNKLMNRVKSRMFNPFFTDDWTTYRLSNFCETVRKFWYRI